jgi:DNA anti-recombination protein RmuC
MQIEESTKEIRRNVENLSKHLKSFEEYQGKLGNALTTTVNQFNFSNREFKKIDKDVVKITGVQSDIELLEVTKPEIEE